MREICNSGSKGGGRRKATRLPKTERSEQREPFKDFLN